MPLLQTGTIDVGPSSHALFACDKMAHAFDVRRQDLWTSSCARFDPVLH